MIDIERVLTLSLVALAIIAVPGPSVLFVVTRGMALGRRAALATVAGNEVGLIVQVTAVSVGLGTIVERSVVVYTVLKLAGAAYLIYLGVQAFRHRMALLAALGRTMGPVPTRRIFIDGFVVGVSNPKSILLFAAILPQFADPAAGNLSLQLFLLGMICVLIALISDSTWALLAGIARGWLARSPRRLAAIGGGSGAVMVGLGLQVAFTGRRD
ncbi:MAG: LysE family translocator [Geodermatophilaceae bacterium]|nr:LysE family translocator [Geodermatophilaceae bacterium]